MDAVSPVESAIRRVGGPAEVARRRKLKTRWGVAKWIRDGLPAEHVIWLAEQTGWAFTPHQLRPDLYPNPTDGIPPKRRQPEGAKAA